MTWSCRQNPFAGTNQRHMRNLILQQHIITCPFGHVGHNRNQVIDNVFNERDAIWKSMSQDRKFIESMRIGDLVVIPFTGIQNCLLVRIVSEPIYAYETNLFLSVDNKLQLSTEGTLPFRPVVRRIEVLFELRFPDKRVLPCCSLSKINPALLPAF